MIFSTLGSDGRAAFVFAMIVSLLFRYKILSVALRLTTECNRGAKSFFDATIYDITRKFIHFAAKLALQTPVVRDLLKIRGAIKEFFNSKLFAKWPT